MVVGIDHPDIALAIAGDSGGVMEVGIGGAETAPQDNKVAGTVEFLHAIVAVIHDKQRTLLIHAESVHRRHEFPAV